MKIRRFGRTEFKISQLTFGGGWVGGILIDPDKEIMHKALSLASKKVLIGLIPLNLIVKENLKKI